MTARESREAVRRLCHPAPRLVAPPTTPGRHRPDCRHCARVRAQAADYRLAREAAELARESATRGYATEGAEYGPLVTFRDWLTMTAAQEVA